jgi:hypothetical protein
LDYLRLSDAYRPKRIETLLIAEAPPPSGKSYFYYPATVKVTADIRANRSLPATIFYHYFARLPVDIEEYREMLTSLKAKGVFLVDICSEPIRVRDNSDGLKRIISEIPRVYANLRSRCIEIDESSTIFLLARTNYKAIIRTHFPNSRLERWVDFRMTRTQADHSLECTRRD